MGMSPDSHFKLTAVGIPTWLNCLFLFGPDKLSVYQLHRLGKTFATRAICQIAGKAIAEVKHQPPMQPFNDGSYRVKPHFFIGTAY
jgi:hypothetical protein